MFVHSMINKEKKKKLRLEKKVFTQMNSSSKLCLRFGVTMVINCAITVSFSIGLHTIQYLLDLFGFGFAVIIFCKRVHRSLFLKFIYKIWEKKTILLRIMMFIKEKYMIIMSIQEIINEKKNQISKIYSLLNVSNFRKQTNAAN